MITIEEALEITTLINKKLNALGDDFMDYAFGLHDILAKKQRLHIYALKDVTRGTEIIFRFLDRPVWSTIGNPAYGKDQVYELVWKNIGILLKDLAMHYGAWQEHEDYLKLCVPDCESLGVVTPDSKNHICTKYGVTLKTHAFGRKLCLARCRFEKH